MTLQILQLVLVTAKHNHRRTQDKRMSQGDLHGFITLTIRWGAWGLSARSRSAHA